MNTIKEFLNRQEESTVEDVANYGVESGAIGELIYTSDVVNFFDRYEQDIENVITDYLEGVTGNTFYDLLDHDLMGILEGYANVKFQSEYSYNDLHFKLAENKVSNEVEGFYNMDEDERDKLIYYSMDDVEMDIQDTDKVQFVYLAVEIVAQELAE